MKVKIMLIASFVVLALACNQKAAESEYYTESDFATIKKIDTHYHVNTYKPTFMEVAIADNFRLLAVNTDAFDDFTVYDQENVALHHIAQNPNQIAYLMAFTLDGWDEEGWQEKTIAHIKESIAKGAVGVKVWKNIGMVEKDKDGNFIMIDNPQFDPVLDYLEENGIPVVGHLGEPRNCWLPIEEMTVVNDKEYFAANPEYHMYLHPELPSYEDQIEARDNMLEKHPNLKFVGAHLGSMEWSVDFIAEHLDRFPNMTLDLAERISHIAIQSEKDREKVINFFIKYQDRIMYGTDSGYREEFNDESTILKEVLHRTWTTDWKFFTTDESVDLWGIEGQVKGLKLPREIIDKIYFKNAEALYPKFKEMNS